MPLRVTHRNVNPPPRTTAAASTTVQPRVSSARFRLGRSRSRPTTVRQQGENKAPLWREEGSDIKCQGSKKIFSGTALLGANRIARCRSLLFSPSIVSCRFLHMYARVSLLVDGCAISTLPVFSHAFFVSYGLVSRRGACCGCCQRGVSF